MKNVKIDRHKSIQKGLIISQIYNEELQCKVKEKNY